MTARQLKNETGMALEAAARGERILITRRGKPVAWLIQAVSESFEDESASDAAWDEVREAFRASEPAFETWQDAVSLSRGRA